MSRGETPGGAPSVGVPMSISQPSDTQYPELQLPTMAAGALRLPQAAMHPVLPGVPAGLEERLLAAGVYPRDPHAVMGGAPPPMMPPAGGPGGGLPLSAQQQAALSQILSPGSAATSLGSLGAHESGADLRQLWQAVAGLDPNQPSGQMPQARPHPDASHACIQQVLKH